ncbi:S-type pyocin domain-containing protein [Pectobacterium carotovorum]
MFAVSLLVLCLGNHRIQHLCHHLLPGLRELAYDLNLLFQSGCGAALARWGAVSSPSNPSRETESSFATVGSMDTSVDLPVRGSLVYRKGQLALELLKTGDGVPKAVRVLMAERDEATGLDRIRVPSVAGEPERTILINPVAPPAKSSSTGNDEPAPVTPKHTGTDITPVESITVTTTPVDDHKGLQDFIYWRPDAAGTGGGASVCGVE